MSNFIIAQDKIIKLDATEIKCKVVEITDNSIKYRKWTNQAGPLYNVSKSEVFMIMYADGTIEKYTVATEPVYTPPAQPVYTTPTYTQPVYVQPSINNSPAQKVVRANTVENNLREYPTVLRLGMSSYAMDFALERTFGPMHRLGMGFDFYTAYDGSVYGLYSYMMCKLPVDIYHNKMKKGSGMFLWTNAGLASASSEYTTVSYYGTTSTQRETDWLFMYQLGCDISFPNSKLGVSLYTTSFSSIGGGFVIRL